MGLLTRIFSKKESEKIDPLVHLLRKSDKDSSARNEFYVALLREKVYVPGEMDGSELLLRPYDIYGRRTLLIFSSVEILRSSLRDAPNYIQLTGRTALTAASSMQFQSVVINYGTRDEKEFTPSEIEALLDGSIFSESRSNNVMTVFGVPKHAPMRLLEDLTAKLPKRPEVTSAYCVQVTTFDVAANVERESWVTIAFATDMAAGDLDQFLANAKRIAEVVGIPDVRFVGMKDDALGQYLKQESKAFYVRGE